MLWPGLTTVAFVLALFRCIGVPAYLPVLGLYAALVAGYSVARVVGFVGRPDAVLASGIVALHLGILADLGWATLFGPATGLPTVVDASAGAGIAGAVVLLSMWLPKDDLAVSASDAAPMSGAAAGGGLACVELLDASRILAGTPVGPSPAGGWLVGAVAYLLPFAVPVAIVIFAVRGLRRRRQAR